MTRILIFPLAVLLAAPALAQDGPDVKVLAAFNQCDWTRGDEMVALARSAVRPALQSVVDDGMLLGGGFAVHTWGDEWNVLTWYTGDGIEGTLAGSDEVGRRVVAGNPDITPFAEFCPTHRDVVYDRVAGTGAPASDADEDATPVQVLAFYTCPYGELGGFAETYTSTLLPVSRTLVDDGLLLSEGLFFHELGDEWNVVVARAAPDMSTLLDAQDAMNERLGGSPDEALFEMGCSAHKDNIYTVMVEVR